MICRRISEVCITMLLLSMCLSTAAAEERLQDFATDPGWDRLNNRSEKPNKRTIKQDFGYHTSQHAGGERAGEIGGFITPAGEAAYYAKPLKEADLSQGLTASGKLACTGRQFNVLIGFFHTGALKEWRTPNTIALRIYGRGEKFYAYVEYATAKWRAGGDSPQPFPSMQSPNRHSDPRGFAAGGAVHDWSLRYDPHANNGLGAITVTLDQETSVCHLDPGHKADGGRFNRFGILNVVKHADSGGEIWLDDLTINGETERFDADPHWDAFHNRRTYQTQNVRPRFDFGFSNTKFAGGRDAGELGGLVFRGDCRTEEKLAYYGDRLDVLSLAKPLKAAGKISLRRGITDSTTLIGFFHAQQSTLVSNQQSTGLPKHFLGVAIEGPSSQGFYVYPAFRGERAAPGRSSGTAPPIILPDGSAHDWTLDYRPAEGSQPARIIVTLDGRSVTLNLDPSRDPAEINFNRFGIVTTWIDGNGQLIYFDDLSYTCRQE